MRLIDADSLCEGRVCNDNVVIAARCAPTVDAVEVVRCKDCKYWICAINDCHSRGMKQNDFCSYGERKDNDDT